MRVEGCRGRERGERREVRDGLTVGPGDLKADTFKGNGIVIRINDTSKNKE